MSAFLVFHTVRILLGILEGFWVVNESDNVINSFTIVVSKFGIILSLLYRWTSMICHGCRTYH